MAEKIFGADKGLSLSDLTEWVAGKEALWGPLVDIGHNDEGTLGKFSTDGDIPDRSPVIRALVGGQGVVPSGNDEVCRGAVYIAGQLTDVVVYRPDQ